jgi:hypothetical protein
MKVHEFNYSICLVSYKMLRKVSTEGGSHTSLTIRRSGSR